MKANQEILDRILFLQNTISIQTASITELVDGEPTAGTSTQIKVLPESNKRMKRSILELQSNVGEITCTTKS